jgi:hypothetical protein
MCLHTVRDNPNTPDYPRRSPPRWPVALPQSPALVKYTKATAPRKPPRPRKDSGFARDGQPSDPHPLDQPQVRRSVRHPGQDAHAWGESAPPILLMSTTQERGSPQPDARQSWPCPPTLSVPPAQNATNHTGKAQKSADGAAWGPTGGQSRHRSKIPDAPPRQPVTAGRSGLRQGGYLCATPFLHARAVPGQPGKTRGNLPPPVPAARARCSATLRNEVGPGDEPLIEHRPAKGRS